MINPSLLVEKHHELVPSGKVRTRNLGAGRSPSLPLDHDVPDSSVVCCKPILCDSIVERNGYVTMFAQDYKARGTQAAPYLTSTFYTELSETKDLVFIRGDVVFTSKLTDEEAKWIMETSQSFYLNDTLYKLLERFNKHTREFEFKDVLQALDMPIL
ncbi:hypothetical protein F2Q69_00001605 [Brassica cretica]|uniref:Uncharacterized protein n=1 Tax=Brassica cretica TaxID=69181 RepID=A0A8S9PGB8_BRACR|nr:hypothetical protein F2Q69_00001605 [Brassica cretica]